MKSLDGSAYGIRLGLFAGVRMCPPHAYFLVSLFTADRYVLLEVVGVVVDASAGASKEAHDMAVERMIQAGAVPITWQVYLGELQRDWARQQTYAAVNQIAQEHAGAWGQGINYAISMLHKEPL